MSVHIVDDEQRRDRLASAPAALGTRPLLILGRAPSRGGPEQHAVGDKPATLEL
ncbi:MAG: hypothetical protein ABSH28_16710 [Acidobacteriota bacterium]